MAVRRSWAYLSASERQAVIDGFQRAKSSGAYDALTKMHQTYMQGGASDWHKSARFLPVHRWLLTRLEAAMGVAVPYWDWTASGAWLPPGLGGDGDPAYGYRVRTGPFAAWTAVVWDSSTGRFYQRSPAGLVRRVGYSASTLPTGSQLSWALSQTVYDSSPWGSSATGFRAAIEGGWGLPAPALHNRVHMWVGGDMTVGTSPNDPLFWLHHANIDRIWAAWQHRRGTWTYTGPSGEGLYDAMPGTGGATPAQVIQPPAYDALP